MDLHYVFDSIHIIDANMFLSEFKVRMINSFMQDWNGSLDSSSVLFMYKTVKSNFGYEPYSLMYYPEASDSISVD